MNVIHAASELQPGRRKVCAAIGVFDGVHLGHQQVIRQTLADARQHEGLAVAITFDCHPNTIVAPARTPPMIYSLRQKLRVFKSLGVHTTLVIHFDRAFSQVPGEEFIRNLARDFGGLVSVCVGGEFTFGFQRSGNVALLQTLGKELKFTVHGLAAVALDGQTVSSTRIRDAIQSGNLDAASQMLGRAYTLAGTVVRGDQLGRRLGIPTANVDVAGLVVPPRGVYAIHAGVRGGRRHRAVLNIGVRPTLANPAPRLQVEAHLLDFDGELYGEELEITFVEKLREEQKFPSVEALTAQIRADIAAARLVFG
ncbi:MAG: bifunctional riboflavin kinase/FAD synthetase [Verrucomicrobia bacterium]|nr:bifunctional riboflavin kinase/FAD synthetase [Verrucomicrobiota bacterium]